MLKTSHEVGLTIKDIRSKKGLTQDQLAAKVQLTPQAISKWENGDSYPDLQIIGMLADIFEVSIDELVNVKIIKETKQQYRIYETIDNEKCTIEIKSITPYNPCEITLSIKNKTNQRITLRPDHFVLLRDDGGSINPKKHNVMDQYDEDVVGIKLLHEIPSFVPPKVSIELKLVYEALYEINYLWIDIPDIITSVSFVIRKNSLQNYTHAIHISTNLTREELIDYYNYNYKNGEIPRVMIDFPKITRDILNDLIIPKDPQFYRDYSHLFDQQVLKDATTNNRFVDFNFAKQNITDQLVLREVLKKNWEKIDADCANGKCSIGSYQDVQDFMDQDIIEKIIILVAKYGKTYKKWTLKYITNNNIYRLKPEIVKMSFIENLKLFETNLDPEIARDIVSESQIVELSQHHIDKLMVSYKGRLSQKLVDNLISNISIDCLETLMWFKGYASSELFNSKKDLYFQKEQEKLDVLKTGI